MNSANPGSLRRIRMALGTWEVPSGNSSKLSLVVEPPCEVRVTFEWHSSPTLQDREDFKVGVLPVAMELANAEVKRYAEIAEAIHDFAARGFLKQVDLRDGEPVWKVTEAGRAWFESQSRHAGGEGQD